MNTPYLIIGAGIMGSAVAMHLAEQGLGADTWVVDLDLEGTYSSTELNAGGVRATWNTPLNVQISKASIEYFAKYANEVGYRDCGYCWMLSPEKMKGSIEAQAMQVAEGWDVEIWDLPRLQTYAPFIDKTENLVGALFGKKDGLLNPNLLKLHFRKKAAEKGVRFLDRHFLKSAEAPTQTSPDWHLKFEVWESDLQDLDRKALLCGKSVSGSKKSRTVEMTSQNVIHAAGAWAAPMAKILGYHCPSFPLKRQISIFDCRDLDLSPYGMMIDTSGVYFHPEATNGLCGLADPSQEAGFDFEYDGENFFQEKIWFPLFERSSVFERLRHLTGWAGLYEVSPDHSAIIGEVSKGLYEIHSFSGHGVMQSYAAARGLVEWILHKKYLTLDLSAFSGKRFSENKRIQQPETWVI